MSPSRLPRTVEGIETSGGTLFVVATPIGNLEDITLRALRVLREADIVAAEDTRRTANLLRYYEIAKPLVSLHEHNEHARLGSILNKLRAGQSVALVSDAGTPGISDPGALLISAVRQAGFSVVPVPGPASLATTLSVSGHRGPVTFLGFLPIKAKDRIGWFDHVAQLAGHAIVFYEAPHRVRRALSDVASYLGNRPILIGREITKVHEEWRLGTAAEHLEHFLDPKGEFTLLIFPGNAPQSAAEVPSDEQLATTFSQLTENGGVNRRDAIKRVAEQHELSARAVYAAIERAKK